MNILSEHVIYTNHINDKNLRSKYFTFTQNIFPGVDFSEWYNQGYWSDKYIPFSILEDNKVISNVSVSKMKILLNGKSLDGIQIGAVGTLPEYRNRGLSKLLMDHVLNNFSKTDIVFLFANDTVLDFYPKFGFKRYNEVIFKLSSHVFQFNFSAKKLNLCDNSDLSIIHRLLKKRLALSKLFGASDYDFITYWHLLNIFPDKLYYLDEEEVILICEEKEYQFHLWDVIYTKAFDLSFAVSKAIKNRKLESIYYYFPPDQLFFKYDEVIPDKNSYLFVKGDFKIKGREFKFPITAQT